MIDYVDLSSLPIFLLILIRVAAFFMTVPLFSYRTIQTQFKVGFVFFLTFIMFYSVDIGSVNLEGLYIYLMIKEAVVGLMIGLIAYLIISALQIAGGFVDFQMGFAIANVIDPQTGAQSPLTGQYFYMIALLFLLAVNGHHLLIDGVFTSYEFVPIDAYLPLHEESIAEFIIQAFNYMFII